jgi:hypothetical protein
MTLDVLGNRSRAVGQPAHTETVTVGIAGRTVTVTPSTCPDQSHQQGSLSFERIVGWSSAGATGLGLSRPQDRAGEILGSGIAAAEDRATPPHGERPPKIATE